MAISILLSSNSEGTDVIKPALYLMAIRFQGEKKVLKMDWRQFIELKFQLNIVLIFAD